MISVELRITSGLRDLERDLQRQEYLPLNLLGISRCCIPPPTPPIPKTTRQHLCYSRTTLCKQGEESYSRLHFCPGVIETTSPSGVTSRKGIPRTSRRSLFT